MPRSCAQHLPLWCREYLPLIEDALAINKHEYMTKHLCEERFLARVKKILPLDLKSFGKPRGCSFMPFATAPAHLTIIRVLNRWCREGLITPSLEKKLVKHAYFKSRYPDENFFLARGL